MKHFVTLLILFFSVFGFSQENAQERAEKVVKTHLKSVFGEEYKSYGFSELYKTSTPRIMEVEEIKKKIDVLRKNNLLTDSSLKSYDALIQRKIDTIKMNKEFPIYDIKHYFVVNEEGVDYLYQTQFFLFPDGKIKELTQLMKYEFTGKEYDWFYGYYRRNPALTQDLLENKKVYNYLDGLLENPEDPASAMATVITTYSVISTKGYLDTVNLPRILATKWMKKNSGEEIIITEFSPVRLLRQEEEKIGYTLFMKLEIKGVETVQYFEFDNQFVLTGSLPVEKPYDSYFSKE